MFPALTSSLLAACCPPPQEFAEATEWVRTSLSFKEAGDVSVFETTIRALGGLLAAHSLSGEAVFLTKVGGLLTRAFSFFY